MNKSIRQHQTKDGFILEYSIVGQGEPVLVLHGGHSSCYGELGRNELTARHFSVITPSRPGYGRTSKELGESLIVACDSYIELLDELQIPQVNVIAMSAGGPSGIHLASRFPNRVRSLVLQSAVTQCWLNPDDKLYKFSQFLFRPPIEKYVWTIIRLLNKLFPSFLLSNMIPSFSKLPKEEVLPQINDADRRKFKSIIAQQRSGHGFLIDLVHTGKDATSALAAIKCPTLIMHSIHDASVSVDHARHASRLIPNSRLCELDLWGHLIWLGTGADEMNRQLFSFLEAANDHQQSANS
ncbi:alpha/beta hydrolase [Paenibacillus chitinolyticus]|uniref:Alpha/beta hydrolase n=1 Tax=Paenibacillus chitinolyticus TaxID=79263 RepID=A0A410X4V8_9BACL|nr:alpha/beta hydrolase [Paenibacillus chitinolyticus]MCY9593399.1 alpha/beta hydrolase [Paenibacillus chitinolyticus]MCY9597085.1 alpha/beta hydrolase [Paenibacillus chitinolyticus]QAV21574.1 alpha/beta hydrolase [Paenibacillus chitinolyticus]